MFQVKEINKAPFEDAERVFETSHPELRYAPSPKTSAPVETSLTVFPITNMRKLKTRTRTWERLCLPETNCSRT